MLRKSKLIIDLSIFSLQERGGISVVWGEYLKHIPSSINGFIGINLLVPKTKNATLGNLILDKFQKKIINNRGRYTKYLPSLILGSKDDILHMSYYGWYPLFRGKKIVTVHDFTHELYATGLQRVLHNLLKRISLMHSDVILCISNTTKADLLHFYPGIDRNKKVNVIPNAVGSEFYPEKDIKIKTAVPYLLWVAGRDGYKNFDAALRSVKILRDAGKYINLYVVGKHFTPEESKRIRVLGLSSHITVMSNIDNSELRQLYSGAFALFYLSLYEGFGLPILEAQRCGCPVICLPVPACKEIGGRGALFLNENNLDSVIEVVNELKNPASRKDIIKKGLENTKKYSWDDSVKNLVQVYIDMAKK